MVHWIYLSGIKTFGPTRYSRTSWYPLDLYAAGLHVDVVKNGNNDLDENISPATTRDRGEVRGSIESIQGGSRHTKAFGS